MIGFDAMGTRIEVFGPADLTGAAVRARFLRVEAACSRFRSDSDLSLVNRASGDRVVMPPLLAEVVAAAARLRSLTGGLVDAAVGEAVTAWGYGESFEAVSDLAEAPPVAAASEWTVRGRELLRAPGTSIDLGGIAKGWTADRCVEAGEAAVVSAGGDVRSCDPTTVVDVVGGDGAPAASVRLGVGALATSSTLRRRWKVGGSDAHHLIDPRLGRPAATPVTTAAAICSTAAEAEAAAKAVLLLGAAGLAWADRQPWVRAALVVWEDGSVWATSGLEAA